MQKKRLAFGFAVPVLAGAALFFLASRSGSDMNLEGNWVGGTDVLGNPRFVQARFQGANPTKGLMDVPTANVAHLDVTNIQRDGSRISFDVQTIFGPYAFRGRFQTDGLEGKLLSPLGKEGEFHLRKIVSLPDAELDSYVGEYSAGDRVILVTYRPMSQLGVVVLANTGGKRSIERTLMLLPIGQSKFITSKTAVAPLGEAEETVSFVRTPNGETLTLEWHQPKKPAMTAVRSKTSPIQERVVFESGSTRLAGTLLLPDSPGPHPAVVMLHGSGPVTRDNPIVFLRALEFVRMGFAVLVFDKRGTGDEPGRWDATYDELADDAVAAITFLRARSGIDSKRVGLQGNSHAGWVAPIAAKRASAAFLILASGGGVSEREADVYHTEAGLRSAGYSEEQIAEAVNFTRRKWDYAFGAAPWDQYSALAKAASTRKWFGEVSGPLIADEAAWQNMASTQRYDPEKMLMELRLPVLVLLAEPAADRNLPVEKAQGAWERVRAVKGTDVTIKTIPGVGHGLFFKEENERVVANDESYAVAQEWLVHVLR